MTPWHRSWRLWVAAALIAASFARPAAAASEADDDDEEDEVATHATPPGTAPEAPPAETPTADRERPIRLMAGAGAYLLPRYPGARRTSVSAYPFLDAAIGTRLEVDTLNGARLTAFERDGLSLGLAARYRFGRQTSDDRAQLQGLRRIHDTVELGGFVNYRLAPGLTADLVVTQDVANAHRGMVGDLSLNHSFEIGRVEVEYGPFLRFASRAFQQSFYGISPQQAALNGRSAHNASTGINRAGFAVWGDLPLTGRLHLIADVEYGYLLGSAGASPLVRQGGSPSQLFAGVFLAWRF